MILSFDIGGTSIKYGLVEKGALAYSSETPSPAKERGGEGVVERIFSLLDEFKGRYDSVAISTAGQVDVSSGTIIYANENIPRYTGTPLKRLVEEHVHLPVAVENDVNSAALGEAAYGAGAGWKQFICLTYGTGIGGALVCDGKIFHGRHGSAGEFGHFPLYPDGAPCACGQRGCYEQYASTSALVRLAKEADPSISSGRDVMARKDDPRVGKALGVWICDVARGIAALVNILDPGLVVLGGGVMDNGWLAKEIRKEVVPLVMDSLKDVKILPALLGNHAGLLGVCTLLPA